MKRVFEQFVLGGHGLNGRPDDAIGLVAFAHYAETRSPLTLDHGNLVTAARQIEFATQADDGTAIGAGLELAVQRLADFKSRSKVVVLLTDGEPTSTTSTRTRRSTTRSRPGSRSTSTIGAGTTGVASSICADRATAAAR